MLFAAARRPLLHLLGSAVRAWPRLRTKRPSKPVPPRNRRLGAAALSFLRSPLLSRRLTAIVLALPGFVCMQAFLSQP
jgi:hypothetical protein